MLQNLKAFGTFLKSPDQPTDTQSPPAADRVLMVLAAQPGQVVPLRALLEIGGMSLEVLLGALARLSDNRLVEQLDGGARITESGKGVAESLRSAR